MSWTVGELARLGRVTVRTLHHYDAIGLLSPADFTEAGYRLYGPEQLERLHLIRLFRGAGLPLEAIRSVLDEPGFDRVAALRAHRERLMAHVEQTRALIERLDELIEGARMEPQDLFDGMDPGWEDEARRRWGDTEAHRISSQRARSYDAETWARIRAELEANEAAFAAALADGAPAGGPVAVALAEDARRHIDRWFYPCSAQMHAQLGQMYTDDPRFAAHYEERAEGLAAYISAAIAANAAGGG